mgnify:FL=1
MAITNSEKSAIVAKLETPEKRVICPRCGSELKYYKFGNSSEVYCPKDKEVKGTIRGI